MTVIAGYPWFGDWGRDTMIALPGLTLATGRHDDARRILRTWAALVRDGLLPNHFPEAGVPAYHAIDAPLWFVHALGAYERATGDATLPRELRPADRADHRRLRRRAPASASAWTRPTASSAAASPASS